MFSFAFTKMHKLKHVHDTLKVSQFSFHTNQCNILLLISHSCLSQCACKTMKRFSTTSSSKPKKRSRIMHKKPLICQR